MGKITAYVTLEWELIQLR